MNLCFQWVFQNDQDLIPTTPIHMQFFSDWNTHHPSSFIIIGYVHALINPIGMLSEYLFLFIDLVKWRYIATACYCHKAAGLSSLLQSSEDFFANTWTKDSWLHVSAHFFKVAQVTTPRLCHGFANDLLVIAMLHAGLVDLILGEASALLSCFVFATGSSNFDWIYFMDFVGRGAWDWHRDLFRRPDTSRLDKKSK